MAERAHPDDAGFKNRWLGFKKNPYRAKLYERYRFCNEFVQGKVVADIPCGTGWGTSRLKGYRRAYGFDIAPDAIEFARARYGRPGQLEFAVGDMQRIPMGDDALDVLLCLEGFEHVTQAIGLAFLGEAKRVLRRGGRMIMTCPVLDDAGADSGNPYHLYEYPEAELIGLLNDGFRIERLERFVGPDGPIYRAVVQNFKDRRYG